MITLQIQVPAARDAAAQAVLRDDNKILLASHAAATATAAIAKAHGNAACDPLRPWGHPPLGKYLLLAHQPAKKEQAAEYGMHLLLFEPRSGQAATAESYGRLTLLVYGGPPGSDKRLRSTQGGLRLTNELLSAAAKQLARGQDLTLLIETLQQPAWWQFWNRRESLPALSANPLKAPSAPLDEQSITERLLRGVKRNRNYAQSPDNTASRDTRNNDTQDYNSSTTRDASQQAYQGGGGQSGGGGASGSWSTAPARASGVDTAGRIIVGVAAGAALGMIASKVASADAKSNETDTTATASFAGDPTHSPVADTVSHTTY